MGVRCVSLAGTRGSLRLHPVHSSRAVLEIVRSAAQLRALARRLGTDLVHANSTRASLIASAARGLACPPLIAHLHDVLPPGRAGTVIARVLETSSRVVLANSRYTA